jgi:uncharacterized phage protein (TIGR02220 family)
MGRSIKKGIDYFSHDVNMLNDRKMKLLKAKHGLMGYAIYLRLLELLYDEKGYYLHIDEEFNILFIDENNIDDNVYINVLNDCIKYNLFNKTMYENYNILTSRRIQLNYLSATERRKKIEMIESLVLVEIINDNINLINDDIYPQSKVKNSKVKNSKEDSSPVKNEEEPKKVKLPIPYKEILDYLNLKVMPHKKRAIPYKNIESNQKPIKTRWNKDEMKLDDFHKCIDNAFAFRMASDKDWSQMSPDIIFNGKMQKRVNGDAYSWFYNKKSNINDNYNDENALNKALGINGYEKEKN